MIMYTTSDLQDMYYACTIMYIICIIKQSIVMHNLIFSFPCFLTSERVLVTLLSFIGIFNKFNENYNLLIAQ